MSKLTDYLYNYIDEDAKRMQKTIENKLEFNSLKGISNETQVKKMNKKGMFFNHQEFIHRFLSRYDNLFIYGEPGIGKSGASLGFAEKLKRDYFEKKKNSFVQNFIEGSLPYYEHVYVIVSRDIILNQLKNEVVKKYSQVGDYENLGGITISGQKRTLTNEITKYYTFTTHTQFAKDISKYNDEELNMKYSNCLFIIDEIQNMRLKSKKKINYVMGNENIFNEKQIKKMEKKTSDKTLSYKQFYRLFQNIKRYKIVTQSATPIVKLNLEIVPLLNLTLPKDKKLNPNKNYSNKEIKPYIRKKIRGYISYIKKETGFTYMEYIGKNITFETIEGTDHFERKIYLSEMGSIQKTSYRIEMTAYEEENVDDDDETFNKNLYLHLRDISLMVYPDGSYGNIKGYGFDKYIQETTYKKTKKGQSGSSWNWFLKKEKRSDKNTFPIYKYNDQVYIPGYDGKKLSFKDYLQNIDLFRELSGKYVDILELFKNNIDFYNELLSSKMNILPYGKPQFGLGAFYCYFESVTGGGVYAFSLFLENNNLLRFERFNTSQDPFEKNEFGEEIIDQKKFKKKLRYAVISGQTPSPIEENILKIFNSQENVYGDYIKLIIVTSKGREGISLMNVISTHIVTPVWNEPDLEQSVNRGNRVNGATQIINVLQNLDEEELQLIQERQEKPIINEDGYINLALKVYLHVSVDLNEEENEEILEEERLIEKPSLFDEYEDIQGNLVSGLPKKFYIPPTIKEESVIDYFSVELYMYDKAYFERSKINLILDELKVTSVDCLINYSRNVSSNPEIDYYKCRYGNQKPSNKDQNSFISLYADKYKGYIMYILENIFSNESINIINIKLFSQYLNQMLKYEKSTYKLDEFYGILYNKTGQYYILDEYPEEVIESILDIIVKDKDILMNKYNIPSYLYQSYPFVYILPSYQYKKKIIPQSYLTGRYKHVIKKKCVSFKDYMNLFDDEWVEYFNKKEKNKVQYFESFNDMTPKIHIIEKIIIDSILNTDLYDYLKQLSSKEPKIIEFSDILLENFFSEGDLEILLSLPRNFFIVRKPSKKLYQHKQSKIIPIGKKRRGRKSKNNIPKVVLPSINPKQYQNKQISFEQLDGDLEDDIVILHNLNKIDNKLGSSYYSGEKLSVGSSYYRILDVEYYNNEPKFQNKFTQDKLINPYISWSDVSDIDVPVYHLLLKMRYVKEIIPFFQYSVYGVMEGGKFKIASQLSENKSETKKDTRKINPGRYFKSWPKSDIIPILWKLNISSNGHPFKPKKIGNTNDIYTMAQVLERKKILSDTNVIIKEDPSMIKFFYRWQFLTTPKIAMKLKNYFIKNNMMLYLE